jgi:hypothetical protein
LSEFLQAALGGGRAMVVTLDEKVVMEAMVVVDE